MLFTVGWIQEFAYNLKVLYTVDNQQKNQKNSITDLKK